MQNPDVAALKARLRKNTEEALQPPEPQVEDRLRPETRKQISNFIEDAKEMERAEQDNRVDLGELPENVDLGPSPEGDTTYYRDTPADNPRTRKAIESRCPPMDFADLVINGRVVQLVPILEGKLEPTYQSLISTEQFWMERNMHTYAETDFAMRAWLGYARLVFSLASLNGTPFGKVLDPKTEQVDVELFEKKFKEVMRLPEKLIELLLINLGWFNDRVEKLYRNDFDQIKNG